MEKFKTTGVPYAFSKTLPDELGDNIFDETNTARSYNFLKVRCSVNSLVEIYCINGNRSNLSLVKK